MKVINDLIGYQNMKVVQNPDWFSFSLDSVLLPRFVTINKDVKNILDIGTGNAPIPLILSTRTEADIYGIEIQRDIYELAVETIELNNKTNQIKIIHDDVKNIGQYFEYGFFDVIVSNPPFFKTGEHSRKNDDIHKTIARHEIKLNAEEIIVIASKYLKNNGVLAMVHRSDRLIELMELFRKNKIEPKKMQLIYPKKGMDANILLIEGRKNGNPGLKILPPIIAHNEDGGYSEEIKEYFS
jgi:tRNA1(Val) A37 N6-methylase TrmN6